MFDKSKAVNAFLKIGNGGTAKLSNAQIAFLIIDRETAGKKLEIEDFAHLLGKYSEYEKDKEKHLMNASDYNAACKRIASDFSTIAPFELYCNKDHLLTRPKPRRLHQGDDSDSEYEIVNSTPEEQPVDKLGAITVDTYEKVTRLLADISLQGNVYTELFPVLFIVCDYAASIAEIDRREITNKLLSILENEYELRDFDPFDARCELYADMITGRKKPLAVWWLGDDDVLDYLAEEPVDRIIAAFGDVLTCTTINENGYDFGPSVSIAPDLTAAMGFAEALWRVRLAIASFYAIIAHGFDLPDSLAENLLISEIKDLAGVQTFPEEDGQVITELIEVYKHGNKQQVVTACMNSLSTLDKYPELCENWDNMMIKYHKLGMFPEWDITLAE